MALEAEGKEAYQGIRRRMALERLVEAGRRPARETLLVALQRARNDGVPHDSREYQAAEVKLKVADVREDLQTAMSDNDIMGIANTLNKVYEDESFYLSHGLQHQIQEAEAFMEMLKRLSRLKRNILDMDKNAMSELRRYHNPPPVIHRVLQGTFLLLGEDEDTTSEWRVCQRLLNPHHSRESIHKKVMDFDASKVEPEIVARVQEILSQERDRNPKDPEDKKAIPKLSFNRVRKLSAGAGTFYIWTLGMVEEAQALPGYQSKVSKGSLVPADIDRQRELLGPYRPPRSPRRPRKEWKYTPRTPRT